MKKKKKKTDAPITPELKAERESVPRGPGGAFAPGNVHATGRKQKNATLLSMLREIPGLTSRAVLKELWDRILAQALGDPAQGIPVDLDAAKLVFKHTWGSTFTIAQDERVARLEAILEQIFSEHPDLKSNGEALPRLGSGAVNSLEIIDA